MAYVLLDMLDDNLNLLRAKPEVVFCNTFIKNCCATELDGNPPYFDGDHLNSVGAVALSNKVTSLMKIKKWL